MSTTRSSCSASARPAPRRADVRGAALVAVGRRLPDLPAQLRRLRRRRHRRPARHHRSTLDYLADARRRRRLALADLPPRRRTTTATTSATTRTSTRCSARSTEFDELLAGAARARHEAGHGPRRQPHLRRAPVVRRVARPAATTRSATGTGGARRATARQPASRAPSRTTGGRSSPARPGSSTRRPASTTCTCSRRKQPDLNWENPRGPRGRLRDDALVARPRRRRLPDGRHQHDLARTPALPDGDRAARRRATATAFPYFVQRPAHPRVPARDARARCSPAATSAFLTVGEMPGVTVERGAAVHRPGPRARSTWCSSSSTSTSTTARRQVGLPAAATCSTSRRRSARWQDGPGRRRLEQPVLEQPRPAARGLAVRRRRPSTGSPSAKALAHRAAPAPRHALRLPGRGARHDQRAVRRASRTSATSSR